MASSSASSGSSSRGLNVIALVSGGKDSFFSALHCLENGHRLVALANLHPPPPLPTPPEPASTSRPGLVAEQVASVGDNAAAAASAGELRAGLAGLALDHASSTSGARRGSPPRPGCGEAVAEEETDLNSFMYQTVGHQVIPLYAEATGIPLYRRPIVGGAVQSGRDYSATRDGGGGTEEDETESMIPLLRSVIAQHPEANALSAGAILSTYQRTRVESVALRLGLTPLAYLWKYPVHPPPSLAGAKDEAQLLFDMAAAGLEAKIIKVASGGLDESFLWENVASAKGVMRLKRAMGRFGSAGTDSGAVLGEGGEFETLVVDGPRTLFKKRVVVDEKDRVVVREGGGTAWLKVMRAKAEEKTSSGDEELNVRRPDLLDERFVAVLNASRPGLEDTEEDTTILNKPKVHINIRRTSNNDIQTWAVIRPETFNNLTIQEETILLIDKIRTLLAKQKLTATSILSTLIVLRSMSDFPAINAVYGSLFTEPNPPSRVTISCGDLLPPSSGNIAIYLTVHTGQADRQGLHVQSRSYWAPANIGPYSQAITFPAAADTSGEPGTARVVHIAGQIPLVPASMELPAEGMDMQAALSLQHLWRVGAEMGVQWWTSGAVYFPRCSSSSTSIPHPRERALLAYNAWREAHRWSSSSGGDDDDDDESGPDLWDRKYNPQYMTYAGDDGEAQRKARGLLPDYSLLHVPGENDHADEEKEDEEKEETRNPRSKFVPFFLAAEVDELPRSAAAEWHAHAGLGGLLSGPGDFSVHVSREEKAEAAVEVEHCALLAPEAGAGCLLHSVVAFGAGPAGASSLGERVREASRLFGESVAGFSGAGGGRGGEQLGSSPSAPRPYLVYADTAVFASDQVAGTIRDDGLAIVPCASIWGGRGLARLEVVALYRTLPS